jgi:hypothetical protein
LIEEDETIDHGPEATEEEHPLSLLGSILPSFNRPPETASHQSHTLDDIIDHGEEVVESGSSTTPAAPSETTTLTISKQINNNNVLSESINNIPEVLKKSYLPAVVTLSKKSMKLRMEQEMMMKSQAKKKFFAI